MEMLTNHRACHIQTRNIIPSLPKKNGKIYSSLHNFFSSNTIFTAAAFCGGAMCDIFEIAPVIFECEKKTTLKLKF